MDWRLKEISTNLQFWCIWAQMWTEKVKFVTHDQTKYDQKPLLGTFSRYRTLSDDDDEIDLDVLRVVCNLCKIG